ncbi:hypothetical protein KSB_91610 [Ktedonobacter robiniae]|uniref:Anticodon-binding domain-containing protein n=1 Tax=Ktedonobacter robiniae TaxID=2778365 RepID=A0ABQ3V633_9CHLR|nr:hypothetical protein KSB_91610 [Ktedonobacter robiniae]
MVRGSVPVRRRRRQYIRQDGYLAAIRRGIGLRRVFLLGRDEHEEIGVAVGVRVIDAELAIETLPLFPQKMKN